MDSCYYDKFINHGMDLGVHGTIMITILIVFFITYVSKVEARTFDEQIDDNIKKAFDKLPDTDIKLDTSTINILTELKNRYDKPSPYVDLQNKWLIGTSIGVAIGLIVFLILLYVVIKKYSHVCLNMKHILIMNLLIFLFVGGVEMGFFLLIASNYVPVKPSYMERQFVKDLKKKFHK